MRVIYHPDFPKDIKRFEAQYREVSERLATRFCGAVDDVIGRIKASPGSAGHFVNTGSQVVKEVRRCNLSSFPFFILYQGCIKPPSSIRHSAGLNDLSEHSLSHRISSADA
jgi:hypothetical protein